MNEDTKMILEAIEKQGEVLMTEIIKLTQRMDNVEKKIDKLQDDMDYLKDKVMDHDQEIFHIKKVIKQA